jgi:hypothetical protein
MIQKENRFIRVQESEKKRLGLSCDTPLSAYTTFHTKFYPASLLILYPSTSIVNWDERGLTEYWEAKSKKAKLARSRNSQLHRLQCLNS